MSTECPISPHLTVPNPPMMNIMGDHTLRADVPRCAPRAMNPIARPLASGTTPKLARIPSGTELWVRWLVKQTCAECFRNTQPRGPRRRRCHPELRRKAALNLSQPRPKWRLTQYHRPLLRLVRAAHSAGRELGEGFGAGTLTGRWLQRNRQIFSQQAVPGRGSQ